MRTAITLAACVALATALGACGADDSEPEPQAPGPPAAESIVYSKSGGVAGIAQRIEIEADGAATVETGYSDPKVEAFRLPEAELATINKALDDAGFEEIEVSGEPTGCADCFEYEITRGGHTVSFDDTTFPNELGPAITKLDQLAAEKGTGY